MFNKSKMNKDKIYKRDILDITFEHILYSIVPFIEGDKKDVFKSLENRWIKCENVSSICGLTNAVERVEKKAKIGFTVALLYRYTPKSVVKFPNINEKCELQRLAMESEVWIMLTYTNKGIICSEIRVKESKWIELNSICKQVILKLDELIDLYLHERPSYAHKYIGQNNEEFYEDIPENEPLIETKLKPRSKIKIEAVIKDLEKGESFTWSEWLSGSKIMFGGNNDGIFRKEKLPKDINWEFYGNTEDQKEIFLKGYVSSIKGKRNFRYNVNSDVIISTKSTNVMTKFVNHGENLKNTNSHSISSDIKTEDKQDESWIQEILPDDDGFLFYPSNVDPKLLNEVMEYITQDESEDENEEEQLFEDVYSEDRLIVDINPNTRVSIESIDGKKLEPPKFIFAGKISSETILTVKKNEDFSKSIISLKAEIMILEGGDTFLNVELKVPGRYVYISSIGSKENVRINETSILLNNFNELDLKIMELERRLKTRDEFLRLVFLKNLKQHVYVLSKDFVENHKWRLLDDIPVNVKPEDKFKLVYTRFNMKLYITVPASNIVSISEFFSWNKKDEKIIDDDDDPRQYKKSRIDWDSIFASIGYFDWIL